MRPCAQSDTARAGTFGLKPAILENKVVYVDMNDCPAQLDILAHVDVVPAGDGWSVTEPFVPLLRDGKLYGRGTCDDKGPAVAALYAMRAVRELNISLKYNVRLILGADEETGCRDTDCYYGHFKEAPCSYSPDGEYPVINLEKGGLGCYEQVMGEPGKCLAIGGGTYAHFLKNGVAFGASRLGVDYHMHGANEYLVVDEIVRSAELFALTIVALCGEHAEPM